MLRVSQSVVLIACVLCAALAAAQSPSADELFAAARKTYGEEGAKAALPMFEQALAAYRAASDRRGEAITLGLIGNCYKRLGDRARALELLRQALALKQELGDKPEEGRTLNHLGLLFWETGEYSAAIEHLTRAVELARGLNDRQLEAASLNNLSLVYDEQGDFRRSLENYQKVLEIYQALGGNEQGQSDTLGNIGGTYLLLGRYRDALRYYQQSLAISERIGAKPSAAQDLTNIGLCYLGMGRVAEADAHFDRALKLARETGMTKEEAELHKGKAGGLTRLGRFNAALDSYALAMRAYEQHSLKKEKIEALEERGRVLLLLGDLVSAERDFNEALDAARKIGQARNVSSNLLALGDLEARRGRHPRAEAFYQQALTRAREAEDQNLTTVGLLRAGAAAHEARAHDRAQALAQEALTLAREHAAASLEAEALLLLGKVLRDTKSAEAALARFNAAHELAASLADPELQWQARFGRGQALEALLRGEDAAQAYRQAIEVIESVHAQLREDRHRSGYLQDKSQVYIALVRLLLRQGKNGDAFFFAEKLRAQAAPAATGDIPPDLRERQAELQNRIRVLQKAVDEESGARRQQRQQAVAYYSAELRTAEREYQNLLDDLRSRGRRQQRPPAASANEVQAALAPGQALLQYIVSRDAVAVFVVTREALNATTVAVSQDELETSIELLRDLIGQKDGDGWRRVAENLRRTLIEPGEREGWLTGAQQLSLVPHGVLHYLPFAALSRTQPSGTRFLVEDYVLTYLPSASSLTQPAVKERPPSSLLALAPSNSRLRYAAQEARDIRTLFPQDARALVGARASENGFKHAAAGFDVVHLATHGFFNRLNPLFSGVQLEAGGGEDGRLEVHEILGMRLRARLVTLSACETALGSGYFSDIPAGDDFVGLTRAFLQAGSASVLATLWEVNDRSTLQLMTGFYRQLQNNDGSAALAAAQRQMLSGPARYRHPYYWAPFVLVGASGQPGVESARKSSNHVRTGVTKVE